MNERTQPMQSDMTEEARAVLHEARKRGKVNLVKRLLSGRSALPSRQEPLEAGEHSGIGIPLVIPPTKTIHCATSVLPDAPGCSNTQAVRIEYNNGYVWEGKLYRRAPTEASIERTRNG